ncbi:hypothetical protein LPB140_02570 [Sphingorhabdus lutea]|uniref:HTH arsR-type domain-containing protein n=1 Tax=Sphingorhabdus lutea TaxID=1913578 RepID=A0A1L3JEE3_9SPHN|nr:metalloregulator ArsR/SmtB family transcription factor [Sphingorhabdus lutea]APG63502.1 hypothetical protein LPB140_02570 [Sphingorhabdus lutea]
MQDLLTIFRALADPTRLRIALLVHVMELSVGELVLILEQSQPRVSRHIKILVDANLIDRRKEGSWVFLRAGDASYMRLFQRLLQGRNISEDPDISSDIEKLQQIKQTRAMMAEKYFADHASKWDHIRSMHVAEAEVEQAMAQALATRPMGRVLDIGTGTGRMVEIFLDAAEHMTALDNSPEMLRVARAKIWDNHDEKPPIERLDMMLGDFNALPLDNQSYDTVLLHQVLHYAGDPAHVIREAARVLAPAGRLMIVDFAPHDREELRTVHAHERLGFADSTIMAAFETAGLRMAHNRQLDGGELTVKIWLGQKSERRSLNIITDPVADNISTMIHHKDN